MSWRIHRVTGTATELHLRELPPERGVWVFEVDQPALVLGSTQPLIDLDGIEVVRRRSGGGAVYLEPGGTLWVDVVVPRGDEVWDDDVGRATYWLGEAWAAAVDGGAAVHRGPMVRTEWSDLVCFAGLGPGEVTVDGRKVVGISQRRSRAAARFQCVTYETWDADAVGTLVGSSTTIEASGVGVGRLSAVEGALIAQFC